MSPGNTTQQRKKSRGFLEFVADNFLMWMVREPAGESAPLNLLFVNREGLAGDVVVGNCLGLNDHDKIDFSTLVVHFPEREGSEQNCCLGLTEGRL